MNYRRTVEELQQKAILWWPRHLEARSESVDIIALLEQSQDDFLNLLSLSKRSPFQIFDLIEAADYPANLFLKHLCILSDYGGEPIQRLGKNFDSLFPLDGGERKLNFFWDSSPYSYCFQALPVRGLGNKKLRIDGKGLLRAESLSDIYSDTIVLLMFGSTLTVSDRAGLAACEVGSLLGKAGLLEQYVRKRYIEVSRITGGATANSLGQLAQSEVVEYLQNHLGDDYQIGSNRSIKLQGYNKPEGMPFDIVVERGGKRIGIEISFQVTTNSTIERKSGQAADRMKLMHANGHRIAYVIDGAGNFQRAAAISNIAVLRLISDTRRVGHAHRNASLLRRLTREGYRGVRT